MQLSKVLDRDTVEVPIADWKNLIWFVIRSRFYFNVTTSTREMRLNKNFHCLKSAIEAIEQGVKYFQGKQ